MDVDVDSRRSDQVFDWSKAIETGDSDIDDQHRVLFDFLRDLKAASGKTDNDAAITKIIDGLKNYVATHFAYEERLMDDFDYDDRRSHKNAHSIFIREVDALEKRASTTGDIGDKLADFIFDWLVSHITRVDRTMISKLNGDDREVFAADINAAQTRTVVDGAFSAAGLVERASVRLGGAHNQVQRARLHYELADASERLISLINLAQVRVENYGCTITDLNRLRGIKGAVTTSVRGLLTITVKGLIDYGGNILSGRHGLPFGVGVALTHKVERIGMLIRLIGGFNELDDALKDEVKRATETANEVVAMEAKVMSIPNLRLNRRTSKSPDVGNSVGSDYDHGFVDISVDASRRIAEALARAVSHGGISLTDLFDENYVPVPGSNPPQHLTKVVALTDRIFPEIQEAALAANPSIIFAVAVDRNGYLPTHNRQYSQPPGDDPAWNAANCRNRRIFNDHTGLAAAQNTTPILLQTYLRDMGGGEVTIMRDASAPITVKGRHWGAFRIGYPIP